MKLYTEDQVRKAHQNGKNGGHNENWYETDEYVNSLTPIELPSDEEIRTMSLPTNVGDSYHSEYIKGFNYGAKWVIEQIKQQGNDR